MKKGKLERVFREAEGKPRQEMLGQPDAAF